LTLPHLGAGNIIIYGNAESGKENLLCTIVYDMITTHSSEEVQFYILDFGTESLKVFEGAPHIGDIVFINDIEKVKTLFNMLQTEIKNRRIILSDYSGDYSLYIKSSIKNNKNPMPIINIIINNFEAFSETYFDYRNNYEEIFSVLTRDAANYGLIFTIAVNGADGIRFRLAQNFKQKLVLQLNKDEYFNILENARRKQPSHIFGRGLISLNKEVYEFQSAKICEWDHWRDHIKEIIEKLKETNTTIAVPIPVMPKTVTLEHVKTALKDLSSIPVGIMKNDFSIATYDFRNNFMTIIATKNLDNTVQFVFDIMQEIKQIEKTQIDIIDIDRMLEKDNDTKKVYEELVSHIEKEDSSKEDVHHICFILSIHKLLDKLQDPQKDFGDRIDKAKSRKDYSFVIIDSENNLQNHKLNLWYENHVPKDNGIWVGNGITEQYIFQLKKTNEKIETNCGADYGYIIDKGKPKLIKLLGVEGEADESE
jgi:S-DNA-T family DNA segregation ATPase FtsK/SpoIIIE